MSREDRSELERQIDEIVEAAMGDGPITGVAVAVSRGLRVLHIEGYGFADAENEIPVDEETVFHIGSISKQFTAAGIVRLAEEERVDLSAPVSTYLQGVDGEVAAAFGDVSVERLLNHTSGIRDYTIVPGWWNTLGLEVAPTELTGFFVDEPRDFPPGERFSYTNSGYALLGLVLESVTGQPYGGWLNEHVFVPNDLLRTAYCDDRRVVSNRARGYHFLDDGEVRHPRYVSMSQAYAAGGICSSAQDLLRWTRLLTRGVVTGDAGWERMSTPGVLNDGTTIEYGYGIAVSYLEGRHRVGHIGGMLGFTGQLAHYSEDDVSIVVLTNTEGANAAHIETEIARVVLGLGEGSVRDVAMTTGEMEAYAGAYDLGATVVAVVVENDRLVAEVSTPGIEGRYVMLYQGGVEFVAESDPSIVVRFDDPEGTVPTSFLLEHKGITLRGQRVAGS